MRTNPQLVLLAALLGALAPAACSGNSSSTYGYGGQSGASGAQSGGVAAGGKLSGGSGETAGGRAGASAGNPGTSGAAGGGSDASGGVGGNGDAGAPTGGASGSSGNASTAGASGSGGASGSAGSGGTSGKAGAGGTSGSAGFGGAAGTAGSAGSGGAGGDTNCSTKVWISEPLLTDFESYDGSTAPAKWVFTFNGTYGGVFGYDDGTGTPSFAMLAGASSNWAIGVSNALSSAWGGGVGVWALCFDASDYEGLSFMVRGQTPRGVVRVSLQVEDATPVVSGGTCTALNDTCSLPFAEVPVAADWSLVQIPWSSFTPGVGSAGLAVPANGDEISSVSFLIELNVVETDAGEDEPVPGAYQLAIDDLGFF